VVVLLLWVVDELFSQITVVEVLDPVPPPVTTTVLVHPVPVGVGVTVGEMVGVGVTEGVAVGVGDKVGVGVGVPNTAAVVNLLLTAFACVVNFAKEFVTRIRLSEPNREKAIKPRWKFIVLIHEKDL
jgi:hypothetical protein